MKTDYGATSKSQLLAPSPSSTERPSRSNLKKYGASDDSMSHNDSAASFELLLPKRQSERHGHKMIIKLRNCYRKRPVVAAAALLAFSGLVALIISVCIPPFGFGLGDPTALKKHRLQGAGRPPFSTLDPVKDIGLYSLPRPHDSSPPESVLRDSRERALPTNMWYQNLLLAKTEPTSVHRAYPMPYVVDTVGPIPGLRAHPNHLVASTTVVQLSFVDSHGLTLGASLPVADKAESKPPSKQYSVVSTTALAATLQWNALPMSASIVKGMPYMTMHYPKSLSDQDMFPTIVSEMELVAPPLADGKNTVKCQHGIASRVESELRLSFGGSDFTWLVFFSQPVMIKCVEEPKGIDGAAVVFQVVDLVDTEEEENDPEQLTIRTALLNSCTNGENQIFCAHKKSSTYIDKYGKLLRERAHLYPGPRADVDFDIDSKNDEAILKFDWDARNMKTKWKDKAEVTESHLRRDASASEDDDVPLELITYALPHHLDRMPANLMPWGQDKYCTQSLIGSICLVSGSSWMLIEELPPIAFQAPRPPRPEAISALSNSLPTDLSFKMASYYQRGAGDTYFSGKMLARMARVLLIAEELSFLCAPDNHDRLGYSLTRRETNDFADACKQIQLPSNDETQEAISRLRSSVEVWINGTAVTPFVYDPHWGGVISCGCQFDGETASCSNQFPDCPSVQDPGMNFGNGFYNDHHFHYGYHIYAAAALSHFDKDWGRKHFEQVLYLVRDIANPSVDDRHFPQFRQKDWYQGNSWASGVPLPPYPNGKNQESSSEAIASYEAVALFGQEMTRAWNDAGNKRMAEVASHVSDVGRLLTATELRAADYYWHVRRHDDDSNNETTEIYPSVYAQHVVGIVWNAMVQFQTWFGSAPYLAIGIQLLPLTAVAESRDDPSWIEELYPEFAESCGAVDDCIKGGWSVLQLATLATVGHVKLAIEKAQQIPASAFDSAGGNGHSLTNTIWYLATRPKAKPIELPEEKKSESPEEETKKIVDCGIPQQCTDNVLDRDAKGSTCRTRISWLMSAMGYSEQHACRKVAGGEFPSTCGPCNPGEEVAVDDNTEVDKTQCPPCSRDECLSDLNRCPRYETTFVCTKGQNIGGCSKTPWDIGSGLCSSCCEVTACRDYENFESSEPVVAAAGAGEEAGNDQGDCVKCEKEICTSKLNLCPIHAAPYLCMKGKNIGGCSPWPWRTDDGQCEKCCDLELTCDGD